MLCDLNTILETAKKEKNAVASVNVYSYHTVRGALQAAEHLSRPVILAFAARYMPLMSLHEICEIIDFCSRDIHIPYAVHLDHCSDPAVISEAIASGFTSVMFDGSKLPFEENIAATAAVTRLAHAAAVSVEAELGAVRTGVCASENSGDAEQLTDPVQAARFAAETGTDALAVSVGTVHGLYKGTPDIRFGLIREIAAEVPVSLVLHGGSDTDPALLKKAIANGIRKINVNTDISMFCTGRLRKYLSDRPDIHLSALESLLSADVQEICEHYITIFSNIC